MTLKTLLRLGAAIVVVGSAGAIEAQAVVVDLTTQNSTGTNCGDGCTWSYDGIGSPNNVVVTADIGADRYVVGLQWSGVVGRAADQPGTWGREMAIGLGDSVLVRYELRPFPGVTSPCPEPAGCGPAAGSVDLVALGQDFQVGADGLLRIEFYETFDDAPDSIDAVYTAGALTVTTSDIPVELQRFAID